MIFTTAAAFDEHCSRADGEANAPTIEAYEVVVRNIT
jgi:hypothetical protein